MAGCSSYRWDLASRSNGGLRISKIRFSSHVAIGISKTMLPSQCKAFKKEIPAVFRDGWTSRPFTRSYSDGGKNKKGMVGMLEGLSLKLEGRHHCGLDDCPHHRRDLDRASKTWQCQRKSCWQEGEAQIPNWDMYSVQHHSERSKGPGPPMTCSPATVKKDLPSDLHAINLSQSVEMLP